VNRSLLLAAAALPVLAACWREVPVNDSWVERTPEEETSITEPDRGDTFDPVTWSLELWGLHDGERLTDFRYTSSSSGAVPAFALLSFQDYTHPDMECTWYAAVVVQGWTTLTEDQWNAWGVTLEMVDSTCKDFDPAVWGTTTPTYVVERLYWALGLRPRTPWLESQLAHEEPAWDWGQREGDVAFTFQLGLESEPGVWNHSEGGAAYALETRDGDVVVWDPWGRPYPQPVERHTLPGHVVVVWTLGDQAVERLLSP